MNQTKTTDYNQPLLTNTQDEDVISISEILSLIMRFKYFFILSVVICLSAGYALVHFAPKMYLRSATVMIKTSNGGGVVESQNFQDILSVNHLSNNIENEIGMFKSHSFMYMVAERLKLDISYRTSDYRATELYTTSPIRVRFLDLDKNQNASMLVKILAPNTIELSKLVGDQKFSDLLTVTPGEIVTTPLGRVIVDLTPDFNLFNIHKSIQVSKTSLRAIASRFNSRLSVAVTNKNATFLNFSLTDENSKRAEDIINTLIDIYNEDAMDDKSRVTRNTERFINEQLDIIEKELETVDSDIEQYKINNKLVNLETITNLTLQRSENLDETGLSLENQLNMAKHVRDYLIEYQLYTEMVPLSIGVYDTGVQRHIKDFNDLVMQRNAYLANSSVNNPIVIEIEERLVTYRNSFLLAADNLITYLTLQLENRNSKERETIEKIKGMPSQQRAIKSIERQQQVKQELYLYLLNKKAENALQQTIAETKCKIVDLADGSSSPIAPRKSIILLISLLMGVAIPAIWIYMRTLLNNKVMTKEDIVNKINVPFLGELPFDRKSEKNDILLDKEITHSHINESFRIIRENLRFTLTNHQHVGKVIQMLSSTPNSGKTFITINLGSCFALAGKKVILLDLDLRKGSLSKRLGIKTKQGGVSYYLSGLEADVDALKHTIQTSLFSFDVIPSGALPPNPVELLQGDKLGELVEKLKQQYDYVLFDSPPFDYLVDAYICSQWVDHSVFIMRSGLYEKRKLSEFNELVASRKLKSLSVLLNAVDYQALKYSYYYNYNYSYNYVYGDAPKKKDPVQRVFGKLFKRCG